MAEEEYDLGMPIPEWIRWLEPLDEQFICVVNGHGDFLMKEWDHIFKHTLDMSTVLASPLGTECYALSLLQFTSRAFKKHLIECWSENKTKLRTAKSIVEFIKDHYKKESSPIKKEATRFILGSPVFSDVAGKYRNRQWEFRRASTRNTVLLYYIKLNKETKKYTLEIKNFKEELHTSDEPNVFISKKTIFDMIERFCEEEHILKKGILIDTACNGGAAGFDKRRFKAEVLGIDEAGGITNPIILGGKKRKSLKKKFK